MSLEALLNSIAPPAAICHVVASLNQATGGPAYSVAHLASALAQHAISPHIFTLDYVQHGQQVAAEHVTLHSYPATRLARSLRGFQPIAQRALQQLAARELALIHNHGLWMFPNLYARQAATQHRLPLLISPRGMLEAWSLNNSWFKKLPAWHLYERKNLSSAVAFHATSLAEADSIRRLNLRQPIALIPNGVELPHRAQPPGREVLTAQFPALKDKRWLLFLSRIHPKKGLELLLTVWKSIAPQLPDWHLVIAGPDLTGYQVRLQQLTADLALESRVTFTGMLFGEQKDCALSRADLFVLPTHSENFGVAIAESLAHGVPVITTQSTPWQDLTAHGCGWWIEPQPQALTTALMEAIALSDAERQSMGARGRQLVAAKYSWQSIAAEMAQVYRWLLGGGEPPSCVQFCGAVR